MEHSIAEQFVILAINPEKGRMSIKGIHFRYPLTGALVMDLLENGEIKVENRRVIPLSGKKGDRLHFLFTDRILRSVRKRKISFWIKRLSYKSRFIFREIINSLEQKKIIRPERKKFLNIIPYFKYWFVDNTVRGNLIEQLRGILLYGKQPVTKDIMLLALIDASRAYSLLSYERGESRRLRKLNSEILKGEAFSAEISQAIREVQAAMVTSAAAASMAAHGYH
jgi:predicted nucleic acid-binding protein